MPDFAPTVTPRYVLSYRAGGREHDVMMRGQRGISAALMESYGAGLYNQIFTLLAAGMPDDLEFLAARVALTDSNLFFPAALPVQVTGLVALATLSKQDTISHVTFAGRGSLGSKVSQHFYSLQLGPDTVPGGNEQDFVITSGESAFIGDVVDAFQADSHIRAIDNSQPVWYQRVTLKVNDYWLKRLRQGA